jgi:hypothetical protein
MEAVRLTVRLDLRYNQLKLDICADAFACSSAGERLARARRTNAAWHAALQVS